MFWTGLTFISILLIAGLVYLLRRMPDASEPILIERGRREPRAVNLPGKTTVKVIVAAVAAVWVLVTFGSSFHQVDAGHVGVVYEFGAIVDQTTDGLVLTPPWREVRQANVQVQRHAFPRLTAASSETQNVYLAVTLNYEVSPGAVQELYREVGPNYFDKLIETRINQFFKDETVQYSAVDVTRKRDEIREAVAIRLAADLKPYSIAVVALLIDDISYSDEFERSIEQKQVASQDALREQERVKQKEFEAEQAAAVAKGEAEAQKLRAAGEGESLKLRAAGQAEANRLVRESLTPELIQYEAVQRLADNIQIALIPSGQGIILDPATLLGPVTRP